MSERGMYALASHMDDCESAEFLSQQSDQSPRTGSSRIAFTVALVVSCGLVTLLCGEKSFHGPANAESVRPLRDGIAPIDSIEFASSPTSTGTTIVGQRSGRCLDWAEIIVKSVACSETPKQHWTYNPVHEIKSSDNRCLDMGGKSLHIWECNLTNSNIKENQHWVYDLVSHQIKHSEKHDSCLQDSDGPGEVTMKPCSQDVPDQKWVLKIPPQFDSDSGEGQSSGAGGKLASSSFKIELQEENLCLDDTAELRTCSSALPSQQWTLESASGQLKSRDGQCLAADEITKPQECSENPHQEWIFNETEGLVRAKSGTCLTAPKDASNGSVATMKACDESSKLQQWRVAPMDGAAWGHGTVSYVTQFFLASATLVSLM